VLAELANQKSAVAVVAAAVDGIVSMGGASVNVGGAGGGIQTKFAEMSEALSDMQLLTHNKLARLLQQLRTVSSLIANNRLCLFFFSGFYRDFIIIHLFCPYLSFMHSIYWCRILSNV